MLKTVSVACDINVTSVLEAFIVVFSEVTLLKSLPSLDVIVKVAPSNSLLPLDTSTLLIVADILASSIVTLSTVEVPTVIVPSSFTVKSILSALV